MGDPAGDYMEMVKARNSARGHLMAWYDKQAMQEHLKDFEPEEGRLWHCDVVKVNVNGLELLNKIPGRRPYRIVLMKPCVIFDSDGVLSQSLCKARITSEVCVVALLG